MPYLTWDFDTPYFEGEFVEPTPPPGPYCFSTTFNYPYLGGGTIPAPQVPPQAPFSISIAGRTYAVDTSFEPYRREAFRHRSIQAQKANIAVSNVPGEGTVDDQGFWRRIGEDWSLGSGQQFFDRKSSVDNRFLQSKGIDIWNQWQISLLDDVKHVYTSSNERIIPLQVGNLSYVLDGTAVKYTSDLNTWTAMVGLPDDITYLASNGTDVWFASPSTGLWHSTAGETAVTQLFTPPCTYVFWEGDRLIQTQGPTIWNILQSPTATIATQTGGGMTAGDAYSFIDTTALTAAVNDGDSVIITSGGHVQAFTANADADVGDEIIYVNSEIANYSYPAGALIGDVPTLWTAPNANWVWTSCTFGSSQIYLSGYVSTDPAGAPGLVYRTTVDTDGIHLTVPVQALPLEGGEYPVFLASYLNLIFLGTNLGLRMCETLNVYDPGAVAQGDLKSGPLIPNIIQPVTQPVTGIVGNGRFVWFAWNDFDTQSTGLGRCDLSKFIDDLTPAYASDLMVPGQGNIALDWCQISDSPIMGVPGQGLFVDKGTPVASGSLDSGMIGYDIPDEKIAMFFGYRSTAAEGTVTAEIAVDTGNFDIVGITDPGVVSSRFMVPQLTGTFFNIRTVLQSQDDQSPVVTQWLLESIPAVVAGIEISVVLNLFQLVEQLGLVEPFNPYVEYVFMEGLRQRQELFWYVEGPIRVLCTVDSLDWIPHAETDSTPWRGFHGDLVVYLKTWDTLELVDVPTYVP